jgi:hypothetical protein
MLTGVKVIQDKEAAMMEVELVSCSTGQSITYCNVKKLCMSRDSKYWEIHLHDRIQFYEFEWYQLKRCEIINAESKSESESEPEQKRKLTAEEVAHNFGMEDCDDFMTALKDTMEEDDYE